MPKDEKIEERENKVKKHFDKDKELETKIKKSKKIGENSGKTKYGSYKATMYQNP